MTTKEIPTEQLYSKIIEQASSVLKLSISQIKEKYTDYPLYLIDYIEKDIQEKSIEIRFSKEGITLTCTFDKDGNCDESFLFPDDAQLVEDFVSYLTDHHDYSFMRSRFMLGNCYLKIKELKEQRSDIYLVFFQ
ncbi:hypothetical protein [Dysgonomonas sp. HGC4]|uniref:hypothetical protein n=1 Tax=Dysgonomonas sp. HGC4 TaxID=1658009 RepID=UPI000682F268|nr:hypothetical protein [Dysgonomonas sp. HGC4]MBD8349765.1 hypothetical protein [Dysgonomonas sp. HGC4]